MIVIRVIVVLLAAIAALFCAWEAYLVYYWNSRPHWLAGPLSVCGYTLQPSVCIAGLGGLVILFIFVAVYAALGFNSKS